MKNVRVAEKGLAGRESNICLEETSNFGVGTGIGLQLSAAYRSQQAVEIVKMRYAYPAI